MRPEIEEMLCAQARRRKVFEYALAFLLGAPMLVFLFAWLCGGNYGHR